MNDEGYKIHKIQTVQVEKGHMRQDIGNNSKI